MRLLARGLIPPSTLLDWGRGRSCSDFRYFENYANDPERCKRGGRNEPKKGDKNIFTLLPLRDGTEYEPDADYIKELDAVYHGVVAELQRMRLWLLSDPARRKTRRGIKRFIFLWVSKTCSKRPVATTYSPTRWEPSAESKEVRVAHLAELKEALK